jgi:hypothetical protein
MSAHRTVIFIGALFAALIAALPGSALASSLLSGYGGPGQGNQAILGSALVNGPRGGGGSGGSSGGSSTGSGEGATEASREGQGASEDTGSSVAKSGTGASGTGTGSGHHGHAGGAAGSKQGTSTKSNGAGDSGTGATAGASFYPAAERTPDGEGGVLGLSGSDLVYIILGFAVLVFLGVATGRLGRGRVSEGTRG